MTFEQWRAGAIGRGMDPDGVYGFQCTDVAKDYAQAIFPGVSWVNSIGYGDAKNLYAGANGKYFDKIPNDPHDPNQLPITGDIIVYNSTATNPYGHIAVVVSANSAGVTVIEQDGFSPTKPAYQYMRAWGRAPCIGWLRPKLTVNVAPDQRMIGLNGVNYREQANTQAKVIKNFAAGEVLDLKGYVHGEAVDGNDIWFVGKFTGYYLWSGAFTDKSMSGLSDLTPPPPNEQPYQRIVAAGGVRYRKYPMTTADILKSFAEGELLDFDAFAHGEIVQGNDVWFRGKYTGGWAWSGGFTNPGTGALPEVAPPALPTTPNQPPINPVYSERPNVANTLWGIDISAYQGDIDWNKLIGVIDFAIIRAGHVGPAFGGSDNRTDPKFNQNQAGARQAGLALGYYWYVYLDDNPAIEAGRFVASVGTIAEGESLYLDMEENQPDNVDKSQWAIEFIDEVERLTAQPCHLYTYWSYAIGNSGLRELMTKQRKLWLAHYDRQPGDDLSAQPLGKPAMHQYTSKGMLLGVNGSVDLNIFYGTLQDFRALGKVHTDELEPTPIPGTDPLPTPKPVPNSDLSEQIAAFFKAVVEAFKSIFKKRG